MFSFKELKELTPHHAILAGNNLSYLMVAYFPEEELKKLLPQAMSIPSREVMAEKYPTVKKIKGMHPFLMMFNNCYNMHDMFTDMELRPYRELMFFFPAIYTHGEEQQLCSYLPVLYLDYFIGVIGGLYLGLRKRYHPKMKDVETDTSKSFIIEDILDSRFEKTSTESTEGLNPFFAEIFKHPTLTVSYLNRTFFYTTKVQSAKVFDTTAVYEWNYKGSVIKSDENTFANYAEYSWTTSRAMSYKKYFHPKYAVVN